ncbi:immunity 49 family protein [Streptomyces xanthochromogenes]|uniref:immunity 49 family protein n=1 Tax=Streptomyces xanthochromogenes TaxID=67384 RepID=UPI0034397BA2
MTRHEVGEERIGQALEDIEGRTFGRWHGLRYDSLSIAGLRALREELLDHTGALTLQDPALESAQSRLMLRTAAECALGVLTLGTYPSGDFDVFLPLVDKELSSADFGFGDAVDEASAAATWVEAFALSMVTGLLWEQDRMIGPMLADNYAPDLRSGLPCSPLNPVVHPADDAEMDVLCLYLHPVETSQSPWVAPGAPPVRKPNAEERAAAGAQLDEAGTLSLDQKLLRILLDDDQAAFETALTRRLLEYRDNAGPDPAPRSLLPLETIALAALAEQAHGWDLQLRSGYLPAGLLRAPVQGLS